MPTASHAVKMARYHPQNRPRKPKLPAIWYNVLMYSKSVCDVAEGILNLAAAVKACMKIRPTNVTAKKAFTRIDPMKKTKDVRHLCDDQCCEKWMEGEKRRSGRGRGRSKASFQNNEQRAIRLTWLRGGSLAMSCMPHRWSRPECQFRTGLPSCEPALECTLDCPSEPHR